MSATSKSSRHSTGILRFDEFVPCGLPHHNVRVVRGNPCTTKSTFFEQFISDGKQRDEFCVLVTLSELSSLT
jgi:KaiC/GvpD/RAD55 family RecA-like ATPase